MWSDLIWYRLIWSCLIWIIPPQYVLIKTPPWRTTDMSYHLLIWCDILRLKMMFVQRNPILQLWPPKIGPLKRMILLFSRIFLFILFRPQQKSNSGWRQPSAEGPVFVSLFFIWATPNTSENRLNIDIMYETWLDPATYILAPYKTFRMEWSKRLQGDMDLPHFTSFVAGDRARRSEFNRTISYTAGILCLCFSSIEIDPEIDKKLILQSWKKR